MPELPKISGDEAIKNFQKLGFQRFVRKAAMLCCVEATRAVFFPVIKN